MVVGFEAVNRDVEIYTPSKVQVGTNRQVSDLLICSLKDLHLFLENYRYISITLLAKCNMRIQ